MTTVVQLGGTGTPGAVVAAQAGGVVYGTAKVASDGRWSLQINALVVSGTGSNILTSRVCPDHYASQWHI